MQQSRHAKMYSLPLLGARGGATYALLQYRSPTPIPAFPLGRGKGLSCFAALGAAHGRSRLRGAHIKYPGLAGG
jgi:hypothetical protein